MKVNYSRSFKKDYKKLPLKIRSQIEERISLFKVDQFNAVLNNHPIHHPYDGCRSINITGNLRALYEMCNNTAIFIRVGSHSELYG